MVEQDNTPELQKRSMLPVEGGKVAPESTAPTSASSDGEEGALVPKEEAVETETGEASEAMLADIEGGALKTEDVKDGSISSSLLLLDRSSIDATKWSKEMNNLFVDLLIRESSENYYEKNENDWCKDSWSRITRELELAFPLKAKVNKFDKTKLKKHLKILKDEHAYWRFIKDHAQGFKWINSKGSFSLDYYEVEHYFAINKFVEDEDVVKKFQRKKSWLKKFCVPHACDYIVKYDRYIFRKTSHPSKSASDQYDSDDEEEGVSDEENEELNEKELEIERKRRIFDEDDDDQPEENETLSRGVANNTEKVVSGASSPQHKPHCAEKDNEHNPLETKKSVLPSNQTKAAEKQPVDDDDIDEDENELLELTGYGRKSPKSHNQRSIVSSSSGKTTKHKRRKLPEHEKQFRHYANNSEDLSYKPETNNNLSRQKNGHGSAQDNSNLVLQNPVHTINSKNFEKISRFVMKNVLAHKISCASQQALSRLLLHDLILFNFLLDEKFKDSEKVDYINKITKEYL